MLIISIILLVLSLAVITGIVLKHRTELRMLNVEAIPEERTKKVKSAIIKERLGRTSGKYMRDLRQRFAGLFTFAAKVRERFNQKLKELELAYLQAKRLGLGSRGKRTAQIVGLLREAEDLRRQGKLEDAEKKYIAVISLDPKNVDAYEYLGNLYLEMKNFEDAREAFDYILKLRKEDASVETALGEVALAEEKPKEALPHFRRAIDRRPGNPKYLDFFIETAILAGAKKDALRGLRLMREANPENQKIGEWERRVAGL